MRFVLRAAACGERNDANAVAGLRGAEAADCNINARQPIPRQKRFREKGGRSDGAFRIGDFLILKNAKHPIQRSRKDDPEIVSPRHILAPSFG